MTLEQLGVNYLPSALQWDADTRSRVLMPLIKARPPSVRADCFAEQHFAGLEMV